MSRTAAFPSRRRTTIRWDRVGRIALLGTLLMILVLYVSPAKHWIQQSGTASAQRDELRALSAENRDLKRRVRSLRDPGALERRRGGWGWCARASAPT